MLRRDREMVDALGIVALIVILLMFIAGLMTCVGCKSCDPVPCVPEVRVIEAPPATIYVVMPEASVPAAPVLESLDMAADEITTDPGRYLELLYADFAEVVAAWAEAEDELLRLNAARAAALQHGAVESPP